MASPRPLPVTAYAAVSPDGGIDANFVCAEKDGIQSCWKNIPVTIIPTELYEAMVAALEIIAGRRQCLDNLMGNADVALAALAALKEQDHG